MLYKSRLGRLDNPEERLQAERCDIEAQLALPHLNPAGERAVDTHNLLCQFSHIRQPPVICLSIGLHAVHLGNHTVEQRKYGIHHGNLGLALHMPLLVLADVMGCHGSFLLPFLQLLVKERTGLASQRFQLPVGH